MNIIEQFGSYENAKNAFEASKRAKDFFQADIINHALKEYRRENNIFEVGDKVVIIRNDGHHEVFTYESVSKSGNMHFFESKYNYGHLDLCKIRHATNAEIEAGCRL